jgi:5-oxopent-3-ene-1,2,5-tricarboxylate decarboxylase / 2-hydroxyhepta-2,4-diene-1,7-dioate isomerase
MPLSSLIIDVPPYRLSGVVVGPLLNHRAALAALGDSVREAPYKAPPSGPILYIKPRNTLAADGSGVALPSSCDRLEVGASLGLLIGRTASRVDERQALAHVAGYTLVADLSVPHSAFYRPSIRFKALDGSCLVGPRVAPREEIADPDDLAIRVTVDGRVVQETRTSGMIRSAAKLLADVSDFMTLRPGDLLMLGVAFGAPHATVGQAFAIEADVLGRLDGQVIGARQEVPA